MTPLVSQLWPQFMVDPAFASCFGQVIVERARMLRQERQVIFTLRSAAPLDKGLCARLLASLDFLKSRWFKMGARICLLYDGFFSFAVVRQLANRLFLFMRIIIKSKCYTNVRGAFDFDRKTG